MDPPRGSVKDDGFVVVHQYPIFQMRTDRLRKNAALQILATSNQIGNSMPVTDPGDILRDNRTGIEFCGDVMSRGPNNFDSSGIRLVIRLRTRKCGKKTVMNVNGRDADSFQKVRTQDLHVTG